MNETDFHWRGIGLFNKRLRRRLLRGIPFVKAKPSNWAIGIYIGKSPFDPVPARNVGNPVLTAEDISDVPASFVADPFMLQDKGLWYMFFEVMNARTHRGAIGLATSENGLKWTYEQIVLDEPFHLSYPYVFKWQDKYYMIPESLEAHAIQLYQAVDFPTQWSSLGTLLHESYADPSTFRFDNKWWMFVCATPYKHDSLRLYYADELLGPWTEHPENPIIEGNASIARPAGRVLVFDSQIIRYTQDDEPTYGKLVRAFEITELTITSYREKEIGQSPILEPSGIGWNARKMHHIDAHQIGENKWIACVDGYGENWFLDFNIRSA